MYTKCYHRLPRWCNGKKSICQCKRHRRCRFNPWLRKIPWSRKCQPTPVFLPGESHGHRSHCWICQQCLNKAALTLLKKHSVLTLRTYLILPSWHSRFSIRNLFYHLTSYPLLFFLCSCRMDLFAESHTNFYITA